MNEPDSTHALPDPIARAWRTERATIVATLARRLGDLDLAEDAVQEAFVAAVVEWPAHGVPDRPGAWLTTVAWRRALDVLRRQQRQVATDLPGGLDSLPHPGVPPDRLGPTGPMQDDLLGLVLACCHPALTPEARVALTLRHVAGLSVQEIAAAFLATESAMAKRLVRARAKIRDARIPFAVPEARALPNRLADACSVIYLVFTEGHLAHGDGPPIRAELCDEALWLARQLHALVPEDAEVAGLLALLLFVQARRPARLDADGGMVPLAAQDRTRWDAALTQEARTLLAGTGHEPPGPYQVEAAIAALHASAPTDDATPWARIAELYGILDRLAPSAVVTVNRAVAVGRAVGPEAGLALLRTVLNDGALDDYLPLHAAHADLLARAGEADTAQKVWRRAAALSTNPRQRQALVQLAEKKRLPLS